MYRSANFKQLGTVLSDLWDDAEERPRVRGAVEDVRFLVARHCGAEVGRRYVVLMKEYDKANAKGLLENSGLKTRGNVRGLVEVTADLSKIWLLLMASILG